MLSATTVGYIYIYKSESSFKHQPLVTRPGDQPEAAATGQRLDPQRPPWPAREAEHVASGPLDDQRHGALGAVETLHHIRTLGGFPEAKSMEEDLWNTRTKVKNVGTSMRNMGTSMEHLEKMEKV